MRGEERKRGEEREGGKGGKRGEPGMRQADLLFRFLEVIFSIAGHFLIFFFSLSSPK